MSITQVLLAAFLFSSALVTTTAAQGKAPKDIPATSTISDLGESAFSIQSDGGGAYTNFQGVRSVVQTAGVWILETAPFKVTPVRSVLIDFSDSISGNPPFQTALVNARFIAQCHSTGYDINMLDMAVGMSDECPLAVRFEYGGNSYRIGMNYVNFADTDPATISCTGVGTNRCNEWTIAPYSGAVNGKNIGKLVKIATRPRENDQDLGNFRFSFNIRVTTP
jgi:hypothetical protein